MKHYTTLLYQAIRKFIERSLENDSGAKIHEVKMESEGRRSFLVVLDGAPHLITVQGIPNADVVPAGAAVIEAENIVRINNGD